MKIVVIGGTGLIGSKSVAVLRQGGHEAIAASPKVGVSTITADGLKEALAGARTALLDDDTHAYRMHVQAEFHISSASSDPEVHWAGRTRGHLDID